DYFSDPKRGSLQHLREKIRYHPRFASAIRGIRVPSKHVRTQINADASNADGRRKNESCLLKPSALRVRDRLKGLRGKKNPLQSVASVFQNKK
ncbi:MAG: hypothetical protein ACOCYO_00880, partial [Bacteroidota bacterium]